jgi:hypothetical protein
MQQQMVRGKTSSHLSAKSKRRLHSLIAKHGLQSVEDAIVDAAAECCSLILGKPENYATKGNSRYGGVPDLPESIPWPCDDGCYLTFVMQVNLAEMPSIVDNPLPKSGILYFFLESDDVATEVRSQVVFHPGRSTALKKATAPPDEQIGWPYYRDLVSHKITIASGIDVPGYRSELFDYVRTSAEPDGDGDGGDRLFNLVADAHGSQKNQRRLAGRLLGCLPRVCWNWDIRENAYLTSIGKSNRIGDSAYWKRNRKQLRSAAEEWRFLWQIESNVKVGMSIFDSGAYNIVIRKSDLARRDFSRIYAEVDTT